jgi:Immunity protein 45
MIHKGDSLNWVSLAELGGDFTLRCGSVFRFPSQYPYEEYVDYMLCLPTLPGDRTFFVVLTGYKAGKIWDIEIAAQKVNGNLTAEWALKNWKKCIYTDCEPEEVYYCNGFGVPEYPIHLALRCSLKSGVDEQIYE